MKIIILFAILIFPLISWTTTLSPENDLSFAAVIPKPVSITTASGSFTLSEKSAILIGSETGEIRKVGKYLSNKLNPATGFKIEVKSSDNTSQAGNIHLRLSEDKQLGDEGYQLEIADNRVTLKANKPHGLFNGVQTLLQLFPPSIEKDSLQQGPWQIPAGTIRDYPEYTYRGVMLDVARHFFPVKDIKHFIDLIALYKINVLHLHLTDDQGWRIEIKKWPKLTLVGGQTEVGGGEGGFYTQLQYTEIVNYAAERFIIIVPEVDMPGHTNAALVSYPQLNCSKRKPKLYTGQKVGFSSLCTSRKITYQFVSDVLKEIAALTPGPYLHVGGDESNATKLQDYILFENRIQQIVSSIGKQAIGWDEMSKAEIKPNSVVQYWADAKNAIKGVEKGAKVIMSPAANAYMDMKYNPETGLGLHWAGYIDVDKGYNWDPATLVPGIGRENILGIEAPLWTERVTNFDEIEFMVFPRLPGYAEIGWSNPASRNWEEYETRLSKHGERFKALRINFYPSKLIQW